MLPVYHSECSNQEFQKRERWELMQRKNRVYKIAACIMLFDLEGKVHVTRRADTMKFFTRAWVFPGGHVDPGEVLEEAALRELHEECGIEIKYSDG